MRKGTHIELKQIKDEPKEGRTMFQKLESMHNTQPNHLLSPTKRIIQAKASNIELEQIKDEPKERRTMFQKLAAKGQCRNK